MGGKGGGGGIDPQNAQAAYDNAYSAAQRGASYDSIAGQFGGANAPYAQYGQAGFNAARPPAPPMIEFPEIKPFEFDTSAYEENAEKQQQQYAQQLADAERRQKEAEERAARVAGENERDQLYSSYMDAAGTATDFVNSEIKKEMSNARLLGIDYSVEDEQKQTRISDYFSTVWGEGDQSRLEALMDKWGKPKGFSDWILTRGEGGTYGDTAGTENPVAVATGQKPKLPVLEEKDEEILGAASVLGA